MKPNLATQIVMTAPQQGLDAADFVEDFPDHELIVYRNRAAKIDGWSQGFECLILVPKAKLRELREAKKPPPFWRHGDVMEVKSA